MSWQDQGRQYHEWFGHGTAPVKLKPIVDKDGSTVEDSLEERLRTVAHGTIGALPRPLRRQVESQFQYGTLSKLTEAMASWIYGSKMDDVSFAHHFFGRHVDAPVVGFLRSAVSETVGATTRPQLAAASEHLADAIQAIGVDSWPRFVADAVKRAHDKVTLAAIQKSRQPVIQVSASVGASGSGSAGSGAQLAMAIEGKPTESAFEKLLQELGLVHGGGAKPEVGPPPVEDAPGAAPAEAPVAKPAAADKPAPSASESATPKTAGNEGEPKKPAAQSGNPDSPPATAKGTLSGTPTLIPPLSDAATARALTLENGFLAVWGG